MTRQGGYSYVEVLVAAIILAGALVPASGALRDVLHASTQSRALLALQYEAFGAFEMLQTAPYGQLEAQAQTTGGTVPSALYSEAATTPNRMLVWVFPHDLDNADGDGDPLTGADAGVVRLRLEMEGTMIAYETLAGELQ